LQENGSDYNNTFQSIAAIAQTVSFAMYASDGRMLTATSKSQTSDFACNVQSQCLSSP